MPISRPSPVREEPLKEPAMPDFLVSKDLREKIIKNRVDAETFEDRVKKMREENQ